MINGADIFLMQLFYFLIALYKKTIDLKKALLKLVKLSLLSLFNFSLLYL